MPGYSILKCGCTYFGIRTFRSLVFSFLGVKVPSGYLRSQERNFPGTFAPGNECSRELLFPGVNVAGNFRSWYSQFAF